MARDSLGSDEKHERESFSPRTHGIHAHRSPEIDPQSLGDRKRCCEMRRNVRRIIYYRGFGRVCGIAPYQGWDQVQYRVWGPVWHRVVGSVR